MKICVWNPNKNDRSNVRKLNKTGSKSVWNWFCIQNTILNRFGPRFVRFSDICCPICPQNTSYFRIRNWFGTSFSSDFEYSVPNQMFKIWTNKTGSERLKSEPFKNRTCSCPDFGIVQISVIRIFTVCKKISFTNLEPEVAVLEQTPMLMPRVIWHSSELTQNPISLYSFLQRRRFSAGDVATPAVLLCWLPRLDCCCPLSSESLEKTNKN